MKDEAIKSFAYTAGRLLKPVAFLYGFIAVPHRVCWEIAMDNVDKPVRLSKRVKTNWATFMECRVHALPGYLVHKAENFIEWRANKQGGMTTTVAYDPTPEIEQKNLGDIVKQLSDTKVINVSYFEPTKHQPNTPSKCTFDDRYVIDFSPSGLVWCGGMRRVGHISKKRFNHIEPVCDISYQLSDYLARIADNRYKLTQTEKPR